jgi:tetratricopeptide (TPR) repeat protein
MRQSSQGFPVLQVRKLCNVKGMFNMKIMTILCALYCLLLSGASFAYSFKPTDKQWATWEPYCRAIYAHYGFVKKRSSQVSKAEINKWQKALGSVTFSHVHHACLGFIIAREAKSKPSEREYRAKRAVNELTYTYERMPKNTSRLLAKIVQDLAEMQYLLGKPGESVKVLQEAIAYQPENMSVYMAKANYLKRRKDYDGALATLQYAEKKVKVKGKQYRILASISYAAIRAKKYDVAKEYARKAYAAGYKSKKLKKKLQAVGHPL